MVGPIVSFVFGFFSKQAFKNVNLLRKVLELVICLESMEGNAFLHFTGNRSLNETQQTQLVISLDFGTKKENPLNFALHLDAVYYCLQV